VKKLILFLAVLFISTTGLSDNGPFSTAPAPTQVYQDAQTTPTSAATASTMPIATPTPTVAAVQSTQTQPSTQTQSSDITNGAAVINSAGVDTSLQGQLTELTQSTLTFEQQVDQHLQNLDASNQTMGAAIQSINQNMLVLQQQVSKMQTPSAHTSSSSSFLQNLLQAFTHQNSLTMIEDAGAAAFLLVFGVLMGQLLFRRPSLVVVPDSAHKSRVGDALADDIKNEYDFMSSAEAIPAKLDLARSYMAMGDNEQASTVLKTVMEKGDEEQRIVAEALLNKIKKTKC